MNQSLQARVSAQDTAKDLTGLANLSGLDFGRVMRGRFSKPHALPFVQRILRVLCFLALPFWGYTTQAHRRQILERSAEFDVLVQSIVMQIDAIASS